MSNTRVVTASVSFRSPSHSLLTPVPSSPHGLGSEQIRFVTADISGKATLTMTLQRVLAPIIARNSASGATTRSPTSIAAIHASTKSAIAVGVSIPPTM